MRGALGSVGEDDSELSKLTSPMLALALCLVRLEILLTEARMGVVNLLMP